MNPRLILLAWQYRRQLGAVAGVLFFLLLLLLTLVASVFAVPLASDNQVQLYVQAVQTLKTDKALDLDFRLPLAVDAVRLKQDFSAVTADSVRETVNLFVRTVHTPGEPCQEGDPDCHCTTSGDPPKTTCRTPPETTYELKPLTDVMAALNFTAEEQEIALAMSMVDSGTTDCLTFVPVSTVSTWPLNGIITSCFGPRLDPYTETPGYHYGIDIAATLDTPILAAQAGTVTTASLSGNYGNLVVISSSTMETWYGHMNRFAVSLDEQVQKGQVIGYVGSTGKSTGPHVHFETHPAGGAPADPRNFFR